VSKIAQIKPKEFLDVTTAINIINHTYSLVCTASYHFIML